MMRTSSRWVWLCVPSLFCWWANAPARLVDVPEDYPTIQEAIAAAADGDVVRVSPGTYVENLDFLGKAIRVRGLAPKDSAVVAATVVDGNGAGPTVYFGSGEGPGSVLAGLTITGGSGVPCNTLGWPRIPPEDRCGGGILCVNGASPTIRRCIVRQNSVDGEQARGGGILAVNGASPWIEDTEITDNFAYRSGGGIALFTDADATIHRCRVTNNTAQHCGGAGIRIQDSSPSISNCFIRGNRAKIDNGETAAGGGAISAGGFSEVVVQNCVMVENTSCDHGGGVRAGDDTHLVLNHVVLSGNLAHKWGGGIATVRTGTAEAHDSIIYGNDPEEIVGTVEVTYSDVRGGWPGEGNIDADPLFTRWGRFEYVLSSGSPCIDAGTPQEWGVDWCRWLPFLCDVNTPRPDMGAYDGINVQGWLQ